MTIDRRTWRPLVAIVALMLAAGTTLAADPSASPSGSTSPPASAEASPSASPSKAASQNTESSPEAAETPEASESPEPSESPEAAETPEKPDQAGAAPSADELARVVDRLKAAGITTTASDLSALAAKVGLGGAVRVLAFAHASGKTPAQILAMFQGGEGWGRIAKDLDLSIGPGIGWIMGGGNGHGKGHGQKP